MMKTHRTTYTLVVLFFASLLVLWGLEYAGVRTAKESMLRESLILPELLETPAAGIHKLSIERGKERLVFERRSTGAGGWQMIEPMNVAAEPARLETLVRNLKELRRSLDAGSMTGPPATFGLDHPEAIVRLWGSQNEGCEPRQPSRWRRSKSARSVKRLRYLRTGESGSIEVADAKLLSAVDQPVVEWRERACGAARDIPDRFGVDQERHQSDSRESEPQRAVPAGRAERCPGRRPEGGEYAGRLVVTARDGRGKGLCRQ